MHKDGIFPWIQTVWNCWIIVRLYHRRCLLHRQLHLLHLQPPLAYWVAFVASSVLTVGDVRRSESVTVIAVRESNVKPERTESPNDLRAFTCRIYLWIVYWKILSTVCSVAPNQPRESEKGIGVFERPGETNKVNLDFWHCGKGPEFNGA
jgi:hypothetical protein